jgi:hypothetical protein
MEQKIESQRPGRRLVVRRDLDAVRMRRNVGTSEGARDTSSSPTRLEKTKEITLAEAIIEGRRKLKKIELLRPKTEQERIATNQAILEQYKKRYTTKVKFAGLNKENRTVWEVETFVKGYEDKPLAPYRNRIIPEMGGFNGYANFRDEDKECTLQGTKALHLSDVLYGQMETAMPLIREQTAQHPELNNRQIPDFDLKVYVGSSISNNETKKMIEFFLGGEREKRYITGSDGFTAFADAPTTESKLRLAHRYNKLCQAITIIKRVGSSAYPGTRHTFSERT